MTTTTYASIVPSQYHSITGAYLADSDCGHRHRTPETAFACSRRGNPSRSPGSLRVDVVARVGDRYRPLTEAEEDSIVYRYYR